MSPGGAASLPTLSVLRLSSNLLSFLPGGGFAPCPALTELYLDNNTIHTLSEHTFAGLSSLKVGLLATNPFLSQRSSLIGSVNFQILDLSSNRIQVLPELLLHPLPAISTLYLENNKVWGSRRTCRR